MPKAKYDEIYAELKSALEAGRYPYGTLMPSENTLVGQYGCSRNTVRRALAGLIDDGYVQPIHGKGVRVIYRPGGRAAFAMGGIESFYETAQRNHLRVETKVVEFSVTAVDEELSLKTGFSVGDEVYFIRRVRYLDGKPLILDINIFLKSLIPGLTEDVAAQSIYA